MMTSAQTRVESSLTTKHAFKLGLAAVFLISFLASLLIYGFNIAMPMIAADLKGMALYSWAISLPALAAAFVTLFYGKLSDIYGRRAMLLVSLILFLIGAVLCAISPSFEFNIAARVIWALGYGALAPLCASVIGDMYAPAERSKWTGLLAIPAGIAATLGPTLVGVVTDRLSWRYFFWALVPVAVVCAIFVWIGVPLRRDRADHKIDFTGACLLLIASSSMILGVSFADRRAWISFSVLGLLAVSLVFWCLSIWAERRAKEPIIDPQVFTNRTVLTAAAAALLSFFGFVGILNYYPLFLQGVQGTSATLSGQMLTPFSMLMAFMGVPAGFLLARTKRYKWMYIVGYAILTIAMFGMVAFSAGTPPWLGVLVTALAGLGVGTIPTVNTLVVQFAVPKRLLGMAVASIFFIVAIGSAIAPAVLGSVMNSTYENRLRQSLPTELSQRMDEAVLVSIADPRVLMSPEAMTGLRSTLRKSGEEAPALFDQTVHAIRRALESSLRRLFLIGAVAMLLSFLFILTIPEVSMDIEVQDRKSAR